MGKCQNAFELKQQNEKGSILNFIRRQISIKQEEEEEAEDHSLSTVSEKESLTNSSIGEGRKTTIEKKEVATDNQINVMPTRPSDTLISPSTFQYKKCTTIAFNPYSDSSVQQQQHEGVKITEIGIRGRMKKVLNQNKTEQPKHI